jgi:hypothetical protein
MADPDIVARLRQTHRVGCDCVGCEAADEIERLRKGGCARDQRTTQFCAEAAQLQELVDPECGTRSDGDARGAR